MKVTYKTDTGRLRAVNEDSILIDETMGIFLIADGLGGHQAGEVASNTAVKECYASLKENIGKIKGEEEISNLLAESLTKAHNAIKAKSKTDPNLVGMGTTLIQVLIQKNRAHICNIGDSRVYLLREKIEQVTKDHTSEVYLAKDWLMKEYLPLKKFRILTQAVGNSETLTPEIEMVELQRNDILLLCTDGLTDMLSDEEIELIIQNYRSNINTAVNCLIKEANDKGGLDNISVILIEYE